MFFIIDWIEKSKLRRKGRETKLNKKRQPDLKLHAKRDRFLSSINKNLLFIQKHRNAKYVCVLIND